MLLLSSWGASCPQLLAMRSCSSSHRLVDVGWSLHLLAAVVADYLTPRDLLNRFVCVVLHAVFVPTAAIQCFTFLCVCIIHITVEIIRSDAFDAILFFFVVRLGSCGFVRSVPLFFFRSLIFYGYVTFPSSLILPQRARLFSSRLRRTIVYLRLVLNTRGILVLIHLLVHHRMYQLLYLFHHYWCWCWR